MFIKKGFSFNGVNSSTYGLYIIRTDNDLINGQFGINRTIIKDVFRTSPISVFYGTKKEPFTFKIQIGFMNKTWTETLQKQIAKWLFVNDYKELITDDYSNIKFYCMPIGNSQRFFTGIAANQGYYELEFECNAPWSYLSSILPFDLSAISLPTTITIENQSNVNDYVLPEITFTVTDSTSISIVNLSDSNRTTTFTGLTIGETIYMNSRTKEITSSTGNYRYINSNGIFPRLVSGTNQIQISNHCNISFDIKYPIII